MIFDRTIRRMIMPPNSNLYNSYCGYYMIIGSFSLNTIIRNMSIKFCKTKEEAFEEGWILYDKFR